MPYDKRPIGPRVQCDCPAYEIMYVGDKRLESGVFPFIISETSETFGTSHGVDNVIRVRAGVPCTSRR